MAKKSKPTIFIKKENKGKFTEYCKDKGHKGITQECIDEGLASKSADVRKRANFVSNAQHFKH